MASSLRYWRPLMHKFEHQSLISRRLESGRSYLEFLREASMSLGLYVLPAGGVDPQQPHGEDEVYLVLSGRARFLSGSEDVPVNVGDTLFVPAGEEHRFHDIDEDLVLLVFFAPAEGSS